MSNLYLKYGDKVQWLGQVWTVEDVHDTRPMVHIFQPRESGYSCDAWVPEREVELLDPWGDATCNVMSRDGELLASASLTQKVVDGDEIILRFKVTM